MPKNMTTSNRINIVLALVAVFLLILGTNRIDKRHFETAQNAVKSVYKNRVLAQNYIYKMNNLIHKKQRHLMEGADVMNASVNKEIETLITLFSETKLTADELSTFENFTTDFENLKKKETRYFENKNTQTENQSNDRPSFKTPFDENIEELQTDLNNLALIQVSETKHVLGFAQKSLNSNKLISNLEVYFLLIIGIIIMFFTFYRFKKS